MSLSEFDVIRRYFSQLTAQREDVILGTGDDCAVLRVPEGKQLVVSMDTLVAGRHFQEDAEPASVGYKALAVNLSDLAAMGAVPAWVTLSLTLPEVDEAWLSLFSRGFAELAQNYRIQLIGGDVTRGPLSITVQVHGFVEQGVFLRRSGAAVGDLIYVTGTLGDAALALEGQGGFCVPADYYPYLQMRLDRPTPRLYAGQRLAGIASAAIDISDGLSSDLQHLCEASGVGAAVDMERLPLSACVAAYVKDINSWDLTVSVGDDYELCLTVSPAYRSAVDRLRNTLGCDLTEIGVIESEPGVRAVMPDGSQSAMAPGFDHFASRS